MANPRAIVDWVDEVSHPGPDLKARRVEGGPRYLEVRFGGGRRARVDAERPEAHAWVEVLDSLREVREPVYVRVEDDSDLVQQVLIPLTVTVGELRQEEDGYEVELVISHARHHLRRANPDFEELLGVLRAARQSGEGVLVTETPEEHEIIDVRPLGRRPHPPFEAEPVGTAALRTGAKRALVSVSRSRADDLFRFVAAESCVPLAPAPACIPFLFPDDGCWARAHEMCRLMNQVGAQPAKVWIYGTLRVRTANNPRCEVQWAWHVAPTLEVSVAGGVRTYVVDPSMFTQPVPRATWVGAQNDPAAQLAFTDAAIFYRDRSGSVGLDPTFAQTAAVLAIFRNQLRLRSASLGPPPYPCP